MINILKYLIVLGVFLVLDLVWLGVIAKKLYRKHLGFLMSDKPKVYAAFMFYAVFVLGLLVFVINPSIQQGSLVSALAKGAFFGLVTYATYDLTNLATIKNWPIKITVIDLIWGTTVSTLTTLGSYLLINMIW